MAPCSFLPFQKVNVFVDRRSAQITNSCQFADVEMSALVGGVVPEKSRRKVIHGDLRSPDLFPLCPCVRHLRPPTGSYHFQYNRIGSKEKGIIYDLFSLTLVADD